MRQTSSYDKFDHNLNSHHCHFCKNKIEQFKILSDICQELHTFLYILFTSSSTNYPSPYGLICPLSPNRGIKFCWNLNLFTIAHIKGTMRQSVCPVPFLSQIKHERKVCVGSDMATWLLYPS